MLNKVQLIGRLGADPECVQSTAGLLIAKFNLATTSFKKGGESHTEWHRLVAFGATADHIKQLLQKGSLCYVEGSLRTNKYEDKNGVTRSVTEIIVDKFHKLDAKSSPNNKANEVDYFYDQIATYLSNDIPL